MEINPALFYRCDDKALSIFELAGFDAREAGGEREPAHGLRRKEVKAAARIRKPLKIARGIEQIEKVSAGSEHSADFTQGAQGVRPEIGGVY